MQALGRLARWPVDHVAAVVVGPDGAGGHQVVGIQHAHGGVDEFRLASITKTLSAWAILIAVEEGIAGLDAVLDPGRDRVPEGVTLRHLLAHAAGFAFDGDEPVARPERTRIYSNTGIERAAAVVEREAEMPFAQYLREAVLEPLGMRATRLEGSPSGAGATCSTIDDMARWLTELLRPTLVSPATYAEAVRPQYPNLAGIVPGVGKFDPCPWGLGFELHGHKSPHWMGTRNSPAAFGHFGGAGTMMWVDPEAASGGVGVAALTDVPFGRWARDALRLWPEFSDAVLTEIGG